MRLRRIGTYGFAGAILVMLATSPPRIAAGQTVGRAVPDSAELELARAIGERLRREHSTFVVFPTFLASDGNSPEGSIEDYARRSILLDALRKGAHTQYADTIAYMDDRRRPNLSNVERFFFTFASDPSIQGDSASVDVYLGNVPKTVGMIERNIFRYWFVRRLGHWEFVRRTLLYAT